MTKNNVSVCLCCNENYLPYTCVTMASIMYSSLQTIDFYILHNGISESLQNIVKLWIKNNFPEHNIVFLDIEEKLSSMNVRTVRHLNSLCYGRYFIADICPDLDKVIYVDSDTIILQNISALKDISLGQYIIGAVYEYWQENKQYGKLIKDNISYLHLADNHKYFSSGVLLIDCQKWRKNNITEKLLNLYNKYKDITQYQDQDMLNKLFENDYKQLSEEFNVTEQTILSCPKEKLLDLKNNIVVRHFAGDKKPWNQINIYKDLQGNECSDNVNDWWFFAGMTPFYEGLFNSFVERKMIEKSERMENMTSSNFSVNETEQEKQQVSPQTFIRKNYKHKKYVLLDFLPLIKITNRGDKEVYKLFDKLTIWKIKYKRKKTQYLLFGIIPLMSVKQK